MVHFFGSGEIFRSGATGQDFSRSKILQAMNSLPQVFFGPGLRGKIFGGEKFRKRWKACKKYFLVFFYENPNPDPTFFVCLKLLISLLNGAFFRLGDNFSVRGYGARFSATALHQLFKQMVGTPTARCAQPVWGNTGGTPNFSEKKKLFFEYFWIFWKLRLLIFFWMFLIFEFHGL